MRYADRDGNIYEEENGQDRLLHWMYTTMAGRASLKILIRPWVSKLGGAFLSSPISKCLIKGFVKNNHIDMSEYERKITNLIMNSSQERSKKENVHFRKIKQS